MRYRIVECRNCGSEFPVKGLVKDLVYLGCPECGRLRYRGNFKVIGRFSDEEELAHILHHSYHYPLERIAEIVDWRGTLEKMRRRYGLEERPE